GGAAPGRRRADDLTGPPTASGSACGRSPHSRVDRRSASLPRVASARVLALPLSGLRGWIADGPDRRRRRPAVPLPRRSPRPTRGTNRPVRASPSAPPGRGGREHLLQRGAGRPSHGSASRWQSRNQAARPSAEQTEPGAVTEIGTRLREARIGRGLELVDLEAATKIRARYLAALEEEQFDALP